jgi:hypothetical protein
MNNTRLLDVGITLCKIFMAVCALFFLGAILVVIHLNTVPELYDGVHFKGLFTSTGFFNLNSGNVITIDGQDNTGDPFALSKIDSFSLFINFVQFSVLLLFVVLILRQVMAVLRSFQDNNLLVRSNAVRKIARYLLGIFIITSFAFVDAQFAHHHSVNIRLMPLVVVVVVYFLSGLLRKDVRKAESQRATV